MSREDEVRELMDIAGMLELPMSFPFIEIEVHEASKMPITMADMQEFHRNKGKPKLELRRSSHSWVRNLYNEMTLCLCLMNCNNVGSYGDGYINIKNTAGALKGTTGYLVAPWAGNYLHDPTYGVSNRGINIGTDNTAESFEDYVLGSQIGHGDGAGELRYFAMLPLLRDWDSGTRQWTSQYIRYFTNHSGGSIDIAEMGLFGIYRYSLNTQVDACIARDVFSPAITIADGEIAMCKYQMVSAAYPS